MSSLPPATPSTAAPSDMATVRTLIEEMKAFSAVTSADLMRAVYHVKPSGRSAEEHKNEAAGWLELCHVITAARDDISKMSFKLGFVVSQMCAKGQECLAAHESAAAAEDEAAAAQK